MTKNLDFAYFLLKIGWSFAGDGWSFAYKMRPVGSRTDGPANAGVVELSGTGTGTGIRNRNGFTMHQRHCLASRRNVDDESLRMYFLSSWDQQPMRLILLLPKHTEKSKWVNNSSL